MACNSYMELRWHVGHKLACVMYGDGENVAVECEDCNVVLMDFEPTDQDLEDLQRRIDRRKEEERGRADTDRRTHRP